MIKNTSYKDFVNKIERHIKIISGYLEDNLYFNIIKGCRLKPISVFSKNFSYKSFFENIWIDEFGNTLNIKEKTITENDTNYKFKLIKTDLWFGRDIIEILDHSAVAYVCVGITNNKKTYEVLCLGLDYFLRGFIISPDERKVYPPLLFKERNIRSLYVNLKTNNIIKLEKDKYNSIFKYDSCDGLIIPKSKFNYLTNEIRSI